MAAQGRYQPFPLVRRPGNRHVMAIDSKVDQTSEWTLRRLRRGGHQPGPLVGALAAGMSWSGAQRRMNSQEGYKRKKAPKAPRGCCHLGRP